MTWSKQSIQCHVRHSSQVTKCECLPVQNSLPWFMRVVGGCHGDAVQYLRWVTVADRVVGGSSTSSYDILVYRCGFIINLIRKRLSKSRTFDRNQLQNSWLWNKTVIKTNTNQHTRWKITVNSFKCVNGHLSYICEVQVKVKFNTRHNIKAD